MTVQNSPLTTGSTVEIHLGSNIQKIGNLVVLNVVTYCDSNYPSPILVLPEGYEPPYTMQFTGAHSGQLTAYNINIDTKGNVSVPNNIVPGGFLVMNACWITEN